MKGKNLLIITVAAILMLPTASFLVPAKGPVLLGQEKTPVERETGSTPSASTPTSNGQPSSSATSTDTATQLKDETITSYTDENHPSITSSTSNFLSLLWNPSSNPIKDLIQILLITKSNIIAEKQEDTPVPIDTNLVAGVDYVPGEILVKFQPGIDIFTEHQAEAAIRVVTETNPSLTPVVSAKPLFGDLDKNTAAKRTYGLLSWVTIQVDHDTDILKEVEIYKNHPLIASAEPNYLLTRCFTPYDEYFNNQWALENTGQYIPYAGYGTPGADIHATGGWDIEQGADWVKVAIIDSGIDYTHPDLIDNYVSGGYDWVNDDWDPKDDNGHGTHCAGTVAASMNNGIGIAGVSQVKVMAEKVLSAAGPGSADGVANGIEHAADYGAQVISLSLGSYSPSDAERDAINYALNYGQYGVVVVAGAGNDNTNNLYYPAAYPGVISVGATNEHDERCDEDDWGPGSGSNYGSWVYVAAPGNRILSTMPTYPVEMNEEINPDTGGYFQQNYDYCGGTSMAAPFVSGLAALLISAHPDWTAEQVRDRILHSTDDIGNQGFRLGRINVSKALAYPPVAEAGGPYEGRINFLVSFNASESHDYYGGTITGYRWDWDYWEGDEEWDTDWLHSPISQHSYSSAGVYSVRLQVRDNDGLTDEDDTLINILPSYVPMAVAGGPYFGTLEIPIMFDGSGSIDLDGNIMGYRWDWTNDGIWDEPPSGWSESRTAAHGYSVEGTYTVKLQVTDNDDLIGNDTATVQITTTPLLPSDVYVDRNYYDDDHDGSHDWEYDAFNNIRDGITHVEDGGTVHVYSGTYGGVLIDKTVNLLGETKESTIIHTNGDSNPNADAIKITAAGVRVNGFTIENAGEGQFAAGIDIRSNNSNITGNIIQNNRNVGILLYFVSSNILRGNIIRNNYDGVLFYGGSGTRCSGNIIRNNMDQGIKLQGEHNIITWNTFYENQHGLYTYCSEHNTIHHNTFVRSDVLDTEDNVWYGESPNGFGGNYWYDWDGREYGIHDDYHGQYQQYEGSDGILDKGLEAGGGLNPYLVGSETWHRWDLYPLVHPCGNLVINNDTDEVFLSIQEAIDDPETDSGHTIFVSSGTYHENLVIDKSITLIGADKDHTILRGAGSGVAVEITTSGVTLTGFTIQNLPNPGYYTSGIYVYAVEGTTNTIITGNIIRDHTFYGIELLDSSDATISDNTFINNNIAAKFDGLGPTYQGITIRGNEFSMNTHAIALENHGVSNDIYENNFISNTVGLTIYDSWNNMIYHNNFIDNEQNARDEYNNQWYENGGGYHPPSGNYWSDYDEIDEGAWDHNNDMIVDVPKDIPPNGINKDYGPYIIPNGWTTVDPEDSEVTLYPTLHPVLVTCPGADEPPYINIIVHVENYQSVPLDDIPLEDFEFTVTPIGDTDWYRRDEQIPLPYTITFDHTIGSSYYFTITGDTSIVGNLTIEVTVRDQELNSVLLPCKSPDYFTDGNVDLCDFTIFSRDYGNSIWRSDFTGNDLVSLPDFVYFSKHYADHS